MQKSENNIIIYQDEDGITKINVRFVNEDIWLNKYQIAEIYKTTRQNIEQHINNIYNDEELNKVWTCKNFLQVQKEAIEKAEKEFEIYREREMKQLESDFDKVIKILNSNNNLSKYD